MPDQPGLSGLDVAFALWTATIRERDNHGLDLSKVDGADVEFAGRSK